MKDSQMKMTGPQANAVTVAPGPFWPGALDRLLGAIGFGKSQAQARPSGQQFPFERAFVDERSANAFAGQMRAQGYHAEVHQCDYDYSWSVEVFEAAPDGAGSR
jgi:hypothetical protein